MTRHVDELVCNGQVMSGMTCRS